MKRFFVDSASENPDQTLVFENVKISVLSDRILRVQRVDSKQFVDLASQMVVCRDFASPHFEHKLIDRTVFVKTATNMYDINLDSLNVLVDGKKIKNTRQDNLKGTARTLDGAIGRVPLKKGLFAKSGVVEIDDSKTFLLCEDGMLEKRETGSVDKYIFAFGNDFLGGLKEFYGLCGFQPKLEKFALGNWWSRYYAYTQEEYLSLMDEFSGRNIPLTVATVDMDWHLVKDVPKDIPSSNPVWIKGWTGYTVDKKLFPDHKAFLQGLRDRNLKTTFNLHPADGVRYYEEQYHDMAVANGIDPSSKRRVEFNLTDPTFLDSYFKILHHPYESDGVDFWWIDWQQGKSSKMPGLDPLWLCNHYHFLDNSRDGKNGLILSRYAGVGSHRYPLGFSGDTIVTYEALKFQPYFTATASNVGYTWWSHDIGGHMFSRGKEELYLRWLQYGVFSPIMRLHSTNNSIGKEPWLYPSVYDDAVKMLQLRHKMLPYIYSANVKTHTDGVPLVSPVYYYFDDSRAYAKKYRNQYMFGSQMLVCPVTAKSTNGVVDKKIWLPDGMWFDFFNRTFVSGGEFSRTCALSDVPVYLKSGAIVALLGSAESNNTKFEDLDIIVVANQDNMVTVNDSEGSLDIALSIDDKMAKVVITNHDMPDLTSLNLSLYDKNGRLHSVKIDDIKDRMEVVVEV